MIRSLMKFHLSSPLIYLEILWTFFKSTFFSNPFACALGYRTLCSTTREYIYDCFSKSSSFSLLCPFNYNLPTPGWEWLCVTSSVDAAEAPLRAITKQSAQNAGCVLFLAFLHVYNGFRPGLSRPCCSEASSYLEWACWSTRRGVGLLRLRFSPPWPSRLGHLLLFPAPSYPSSRHTPSSYVWHLASRFWPSPPCLNWPVA